MPMTRRLTISSVVLMTLVVRVPWGRSASGAPPDADQVPRNRIENSLHMKLALVPAGEFVMGAADDDTFARDHERPRHRVRITKPFYLGETEVT